MKLRAVLPTLMFSHQSDLVCFELLYARITAVNACKIDLKHHKKAVGTNHGHKLCLQEFFDTKGTFIVRDMIKKVRLLMPEP